jgi:uncharacterized protein YjbI with pentapeptide repeats/DNA-binding Xre family transcriptional regulator
MIAEMLADQKTNSNMTDSSLPRKKKKVTLKASAQGIATAETALIRLGFESKFSFAASQLIGRNTVTKFFQGEPIQLDSLKRMCTALELSWQEIAGISPAAEENRSSGIEANIPNETEAVGEVQTIRRVTVVDPNSGKVKAVITLKGDVDSVDNWEIIQLLLRQHSGSSINIINIESGSIRLIVEGSQADIQKLIDTIRSGELVELNDLPVQNIENSVAEKIDKWDLVKAIVDRRITDRNLSDADLSDADLRGANLKRANLSDADLRGANLRRANLSDADLSDADLSDADLSSVNLSDADLRRSDLSDADLRRSDLRGANLSGANLFYANLRGADLSGADVKKTRFGDNQGISESMKLDLKLRGAIFEDAPGDRSKTYGLRK